jgi:hypothetical protein
VFDLHSSFTAPSWSSSPGCVMISSSPSQPSTLHLHFPYHLYQIQPPLCFEWPLMGSMITKILVLGAAQVKVAGEDGVVTLPVGELLKSFL